MTAVELIHRALPVSDPDYPALPEAPVDGVCCITGQAGPTLPRKSLLGPSFTTGDLLALPSGDRVGVAAFVALKYKWERMSAWVCDGDTFRRLDRQGVRACVFGSPPPRPWTGFATTSYKKHGALLAPVNGPGRNVWLWDVETVDCSDGAAVLSLWSRLRAAQDAGIGRQLIESLDCPPWMVARIGMGVWLDFEAWARPRHKSALYRLLAYLLPSQEELRVLQKPA